LRREAKHNGESQERNTLFLEGVFYFWGNKEFVSFTGFKLVD